MHFCCRLEILFVSALLRLGDFHFAEVLQIALIFVDLKQRINLRVIKNLRRGRHVVERNGHLDLVLVVLRDDSRRKLFELVLVEPEGYLYAFLSEPCLCFVVNQLLFQFLQNWLTIDIF